MSGADPALPDDEGFYTLPSVAVMARAACISEREFRRGLKIAEATGWLIVRGNLYCPIVPDHLTHRVDELIAEADAGGF